MTEHTLDPGYVHHEGFTVIGYAAHGDPSKHDYHDLWDNRYGPYSETVSALSTDGAYYSVYICHTGTPEGVETVVGMAVQPEAAPPEGLVRREVPPGQYAVFETPFDAIGPTWGRIAGEWQPTSACDFDTSRPDFEQFLPQGEGEAPQVRIWVSVKPR